MYLWPLQAISSNLGQYILFGLRLSLGFARFPFLRLQQAEGEVVLTWKCWQVLTYLYVWWNFS